ncbi:MAG: 23S rRNA (guanosine(2251)-2'-O)-methyltransferase RlmB [Geopsychrobacter sp.]|nr:23S rRNA (guanosine(2251)-2'-O)-methyltransferase RlmB [Geopsychrobacter sp.]
MSDLIHGINPVAEALTSGSRKPLELILPQGRIAHRLDDLRQQAEQQGVKIKLAEKGELDRLAGHNRHQQVLLRLPAFFYADLNQLLGRWRQSGNSAFLLLLDGITDPHNLGALLRSAEIAGCHGVIVAKDRSCPVTPVVEKTAAGALSHLPLCQVTNLARTVEELKAAGIWCYGLAGDEGSQNLFATDLTGDLALIVGSEGKGLRPNVRKHCDGLLSIPMRGQVESLNASVAAGVALFEVVRQISFKNNPEIS